MTWRTHHHLHWSKHLHSHHRLVDATYVGRVGALAVAFGIGTATASGMCAACAYADAGDSTTFSPGPVSTSSSQLANPGARGPSKGEPAPNTTNTRANRTSASATVDLVDVGSADIDPMDGSADVGSPRAGSTPSRGAAGASGDEALPRRETGPRSADSVRAATAAPIQVTPAAPISTPQAPPDGGVDAALASAGPVDAVVADIPEFAPILAATSPVALPVRSQIPQPLAQPVTIASPQAASTSFLTTVGSVMAALSDAVSGGAPTTPADASLALLMSTARRAGRTADMRGSTVSTTSVAAAATATTTTTGATITLEAEKWTVSPTGVSRTVLDRTASGRSALVLTGSGTASATVTLPASTGLTIRARASAGTPNMTLSIDGVPVTTVVVKSTKWTDYTITGALGAGPHVLSISSTSATALKSLYLDKVTTRTGPFIEEFTGKRGSAPGSTWTVKTGRGWTIGTETYSTRNATLDGAGRLVLQATKSSSGYTSGGGESKNTLSLGYGTTTARIKVPKGQGLWPAFWLKGADEDTTAWPKSGEIDVLELPSTTTTIYSTLHGPIAGSTSTQQAQIVSTVPDLSTDFHNYWVRHLPNEITFGVDGQTLGTLTPDSLPEGAEWVYNRPMHVVMNLAVGGSCAGDPSSSTQFPAAMFVDWVRWDPA